MSITRSIKPITLEDALKNYLLTPHYSDERKIKSISDAENKLDALTIIAKEIGENSLNILDYPTFVSRTIDGQVYIFPERDPLTKLGEQYDNPEVKLLCLAWLMPGLWSNLCHICLENEPGFLLMGGVENEDDENVDFLMEISPCEVDNCGDAIDALFTQWKSSFDRDKVNMEFIKVAQEFLSDTIDRLKKSLPYNDGSFNGKQHKAYLSHLDVQDNPIRFVLKAHGLFNANQKAHPLIKNINAFINEIDNQSHKIKI